MLDVKQRWCEEVNYFLSTKRRVELLSDKLWSQALRILHSAWGSDGCR